MAPMLWETALQQWRLPPFGRHSRNMAGEAAQANLGYDRVLVARAEQEGAQREKHRHAPWSRAARFPARKELADVDGSCLPPLHKPQILDLARGASIPQAAPRRMRGNPGLGNPPRAPA